MFYSTLHIPHTDPERIWKMPELQCNFQSSPQLGLLHQRLLPGSETFDSGRVFFLSSLQDLVLDPWYERISHESFAWFQKKNAFVKWNDRQENLKLGMYQIDPGCSVQMECMGEERVIVLSTGRLHTILSLDHMIWRLSQSGIDMNRHWCTKEARKQTSKQANKQTSKICFLVSYCIMPAFYVYCILLRYMMIDWITVSSKLGKSSNKSSNSPYPLHPTKSIKNGWYFKLTMPETARIPGGHLPAEVSSQVPMVQRLVAFGSPINDVPVLVELARQMWQPGNMLTGMLMWQIVARIVWDYPCIQYECESKKGWKAP